MAAENTENESTGSDLEVSNQNEVELTAKEYSEYFQVNPERGQKSLDEKIEELLTRLEEFCAVVDIIRTDSSLALNRSLPEAHAKALEVQSVFEKIDELEAFVSVVKQNINILDEQVNTAERDLGALKTVKSLFKSFPLFGQKKNSMSFKSTKKYIPPEIFKTSDYILSPDSQEKLPSEG